MRKPALAAAAVAALALGLWFAWGPRPSSRRELVRPEEPAPTPRPATEERLASGDSMAVESPVEPVETPETPSGRTSPYEDELARGLWIEGRVVLPPGTPAGEEIELVAHGRDFEHGPRYRATLAADGTFRLAFAAGTRRGTVVLEARHLYLEERVSLDPRKPGEPLVIEPKLGGALVVDAAWPARPDGADPKLEFALSLLSAGLVSLSPTTATSAHAEFHGVPPNDDYWLQAVADDLAPGGEGEVRIVAGEDTHVALELENGKTVIGRVVDEDGKGIEGVHVGTEFGWSPARAATTAADGAFRLSGLGPIIRIQAVKLGFLSCYHELDADAEVEEHVELVLRRGTRIAGRVELPGGGPAEGATVSVDRPGSTVFVTRDGAASVEPPKEQEFPLPATTAADGTFEIVGLLPGPLTVRARTNLEEEVSETSSITGKERKRKRRTPLVAELTVEAGTEDLVLRFAVTQTLVGVVRDEQGMPISQYTIGASSWAKDASASQVVRDASGRFELRGVFPGEWDVEVMAEGYGPEETEIEWTDEPQELEIVLSRSSTVSGIVLDPEGRAVSGAEVWLGSQRSPSEIDSERDRSARAGADGRFEVDDVPPGHCVLVASGKGGVPGRAEFDLEAGANLTDIELRLRRPGGIEGRVLDASGLGVPDAEVRVHAFGAGSRDGTTTSDASGAFALDGVIPGRCTLFAEPSRAEIEAVFGAGADASAAGLLRRTAEIEVVEGQVVQIDLTAPLLEPVRLIGSVRAGGAPLAFAELQADRGVQEQGPRAATDADGRYSITLPAPGNYAVIVTHAERGLGAAVRIDVPAREEYHFDLVLETGVVRGIVVGPDGRPAAEVRLTASEQGRQSWGSTRTIADGSYSLELEPGTYSIDAELSHGGRSQAKDRRDVLVTAGARLEGIDFRLRAPGTIEGRVLSAEGAPVPRARIHAYDGRGLLRAGGVSLADEQGRFSIPDVAPGEIHVAASDDVGAVSAYLAVEVSPDRTSSVDLTLSPGTWLWVRALGPDGTPVTTSVEVVDAAGAPQVLFRHEEEVWWYGLVPPGRYTANARSGERTATGSIVVAAGEESRSLELALE